MLHNKIEQDSYRVHSEEIIFFLAQLSRIRLCLSLILQENVPIKIVDSIAWVFTKKCPLKISGATSGYKKTPEMEFYTHKQFDKRIR